MTDWLATTDWLTDWPLTDCLTDPLTNWPTDWLTTWPTGYLTDWLADWLTTWPTDWLTDWLPDRLTDWPTVLLTESVLGNFTKLTYFFQYVQKRQSKLNFFFSFSEFIILRRVTFNGRRRGRRISQRWTRGFRKTLFCPQIRSAPVRRKTFTIKSLQVLRSRHESSLFFYYLFMYLFLS